MRIRSVKASYWQHVMHSVISIEASCLGAAILNYADDEGREEASPGKLQSLLAYRQIDVEKCLRELERVHWLILYEPEIDGFQRRLFQIVTFARHQSINHWTPSHLPAPEGWTFVRDERGPGEKNLRAGKWIKNEALASLPGRLRERSGSPPTESRERSHDGSGSGPTMAAGAVGEESRGKDGGRELGRNEGRNPRGRAGGGSSLPSWRQVEALEREIAEHVANPQSVFSGARAATKAEKADYLRLLGELETLKSGRRAGQEGKG